MLVKKGAKGRHVKEIQTLLDFHGFWTYSKITDYFGDVTEDAVKRFQKDRGLKDDGVVGDQTIGELLEGVDADLYTIDDEPSKSAKPGAPVADTDNKIAMLGKYTCGCGLEIDRAYLDTDEYVRDYGEIEPEYFFIHHTAGWDNPYNTINSWNRDKRGRVATQYCIGGVNIKTGNATHDGVVVECFPDNYLGWHLGKVGNFNMSKFSSAVEINNFGYVTEKAGKFYNYVNVQVPEDMVVDLGYKFRGHRFWHKYTDAQIESLSLLFKHVQEIYPSIDMSAGLPALLKKGVDPKDAFEFNLDAYNGKVKGLWTHTNVRKDKFDCFPQVELVDALMKL